MEKNKNKHSVLKIIQDCPRLKKKADDRKRRKGGNRKRTRNTSNINTNITQASIAGFHTSHTNDNSIPVQVQMIHMGRQIVVNAVSTNNYVSVNGLIIPKQLSIQYDDGSRIPSMGISKITTRNFYVSSNNFTRHDSKIGYNSSIEINSHADTHCFDKKF